MNGAYYVNGLIVSHYVQNTIEKKVRGHHQDSGFKVWKATCIQSKTKSNHTNKSGRERQNGCV